MSGNLTRDQILARKTGRGVATLPDGSTVGIRALTRDEVLRVQEDTKALADKDNLIVSLGMTEPQLTVEEVALWASQGAAGDLTAVSDAIAVLSGLAQGAGKSGVPRAGRRSRS